MKIDHATRARKAWKILAVAARSGKPVTTYGALSAKLGLHPRSARWFLSVIQDYCSREELPPLQALAVNGRTGIPGVGYIGSGRTPADHKKDLKKVYALGKKWPLTAPTFAP
jgi:alkylated DNA nucleotide flippase Atl1